MRKFVPSQSHTTKQQPHLDSKALSNTKVKLWCSDCFRYIFPTCNLLKLKRDTQVYSCSFAFSRTLPLAFLLSLTSFTNLNSSFCGKWVLICCTIHWKGCRACHWCMPAFRENINMPRPLYWWLLLTCDQCSWLLAKMYVIQVSPYGIKANSLSLNYLKEHTFNE